MGLEVGVGGTEEEEEEERERIPLCESIGHQPLRGHCPSAPSTSSTAYLGRARVPLTSFCAFATIVIMFYFLNEQGWIDGRDGQ